MGRLGFTSPPTFDISATEPKITLANQCSSSQGNNAELLFPQHSEDTGLAKPISVMPGSLCQTAQHSLDEQIAVSSESISMPQGSWSPQPDQPLSDLEEIKPEKLDRSLSESSEGSPEVDQMYMFEDLSPEDQCSSQHSSTVVVSVSSVIQLAEDNNCTNLAVTESTHAELVLVTPDMPKTPDMSPMFPTESFLIPESPQGFDKVMEPSLDSSCPTDRFQSDKCDDNHTEMFSEQMSAQSSAEPEDSSSLYLPHLTETVKVGSHFSFEQLMPYPSSGHLETFSDEDRPRITGHDSEESLSSVDYKHFDSQSLSVEHKADTPSSTSDEEYSSPPGYAECLSMKNAYTPETTGYAEVLHSGTDCPTFEHCDSESYFDCKQAASDFSETEPDEPETKKRSVRDHFEDHGSHPRVLEKINQRALLSSGSEDYEDATFPYETLHNTQEETKELQLYSETSDEEFTLCEASQPPPVCTFWVYGDTDKPLKRVR